MKRSSMPSLTEDVRPPVSLCFYMKTLGQGKETLDLCLVDDNARIHKSRSYFRIELTPSDLSPVSWCPKNDPVVGTASSKKNRWGITSGQPTKCCEEQKQEGSSEFFIKKPGRRSSIEYDSVNRYCEPSVPPVPTSIPGKTDEAKAGIEKKENGEKKKSWKKLLHRASTAIPKGAVPSLRRRGMSPIRKSTPPSKPARSLSPVDSDQRAHTTLRSSGEHSDDCPVKLPMRGTSVCSGSSVSSEGFETDPEDECDCAADFSIGTPIQSPNPTVQLSVPKISGSSSGSFQRRAPSHTNSFELTHRRSVRKTVKRRAIKMTQEELQSRFYEILLQNDDADEDSNNDHKENGDLQSLFHSSFKTAAEQDDEGLIEIKPRFLASKQA